MELTPTAEEALEVLKQALDQAFKKGAYSLADAKFITKALETLFPQENN
jgi:hypothetical protein